MGESWKRTADEELAGIWDESRPQERKTEGNFCVVGVSAWWGYLRGGGNPWPKKTTNESG